MDEAEAAINTGYVTKMLLYCNENVTFLAQNCAENGPKLLRKCVEIVTKSCYDGNIRKKGRNPESGDSFLFLFQEGGVISNLLF